MIRRLPLLLLLAASTAQAGTYAEGKALVRSGQLYEAAHYWLDALNQDAFDRGALKGLDRWAEGAYEQRLDLAQEHEAERRYEASLAVYDDLLLLDAQLRGVAAIVYPDHQAVLTQARADTYQAWVQNTLREGAAALASKDWVTAEQRYLTALQLQPDLADAKRQLAIAQTQRGHQHFALLHYRDAVTAFDAAVANGAGREAKAWSATLHQELGRSFMSRGSCRQAATEFTAAERAGGVGALGELQVLAEDCARVELVVKPVEVDAAQAIAGTSAAGMLGDRLESALRATGSPYLRLIDAASTTASDALGAGLDGRRAGSLYEVRARLTQLVVERPEPVTTPGTTPATYQVVCPLPEGVYYRADEWCDASASLAYEDYSARVLATAAGSVRVIEPTSSEQLLTRPVSTQLERSSRQLRGFRRADDQQAVQVAATPGSDRYAIPQALLDLRTQPSPLPGDATLTADVTTALAESMAAAILETVDAPAALPDPQVIDNFPTPLLDAAQLDLTGGKGEAETIAPPPPPAPIIVQVPAAPTP